MNIGKASLLHDRYEPHAMRAQKHCAIGSLLADWPLADRHWYRRAAPLADWSGAHG